MPEILPENPYNPGHAEDCSLVEIDPSVIPPLEGREGTYPRYARLVYMINSPSGGTGGNGDNYNKGWFKDYDALHEAHPTGVDGDHAIVGSTNTIWVWDSTSNDWVNSDRKGEVDSVNGYTGVVVLNATDISSNVVGLQSDNVGSALNELKSATNISTNVAGIQSNNVESALSELHTEIGQNTGKIANTDLRTAFISTIQNEHLTEIEGILNIKDNSPHNADIQLNGQSINDIFETKITAGDGITISDNNEISTILKTINGHGVGHGGVPGNIQISANDVGTLSQGQIENLLSEKQDTLIAGDGIIIDPDTDIISVTGTTVGSVRSVNTIGPDNNGDISLTASDVNAYSQADINEGFYNKDTIDGFLLLKASNDTVNALNENKADKTQVANISTQDVTTLIAGTLNVVENGENGAKIITNDLDAASITISNGEEVTISQFDKTIDSSASDNGLPTSKAVSNAISTAYSAIEDSIDNKQNKEDNTLATNDKTIVGAINEIRNSITTLNEELDTKQDISNLVTIIALSSTDEMYPSAKAVYTAIQSSVKFTTSIEVSITPTEAKVATSIPDAQTKPAKVMVVPKIANIGAVYIKEGANSEYSGINPIYPDPTNNMYEFANLSDVRIFVDNIGDSTDLIINYKE